MSELSPLKTALQHGRALAREAVNKAAKSRVKTRKTQDGVRVTPEHIDAYGAEVRLAETAGEAPAWAKDPGRWAKAKKASMMAYAEISYPFTAWHYFGGAE